MYFVINSRNDSFLEDNKLVMGTVVNSSHDYYILDTNSLCISCVSYERLYELVTKEDNVSNIVENDNGFLSIGLGKLNKSDLKVQYTGTVGMKFSKILSLISLIVFEWYIIASKFEKPEKKEETIEN